MGLHLLIRKDGNVLFNDTLNTFYLQLYGVTHIVKDWLEREKAQWVHHEGSIQRSMSERSYDGATSVDKLVAGGVSQLLVR